jgi:hypothetical protein
MNVEQTMDDVEGTSLSVAKVLSKRGFGMARAALDHGQHSSSTGQIESLRAPT